MDWKRSRRSLGDSSEGRDVSIKLTFYLVGFVALQQMPFKWLRPGAYVPLVALIYRLQAYFT
jgi:hypothetical protein